MDYRFRFIEPKMCAGCRRGFGFDKLEVRRHGLDRRLLMGCCSALLNQRLRGGARLGGSTNWKFVATD
jgi:hypothetical protein